MKSLCFTDMLNTIYTILKASGGKKFSSYNRQKPTEAAGFVYLQQILFLVRSPRTEKVRSN